MSDHYKADVRSLSELGDKWTQLIEKTKQLEQLKESKSKIKIRVKSKLSEQSNITKDNPNVLSQFRLYTIKGRKAIEEYEQCMDALSSCMRDFALQLDSSETKMLTPDTIKELQNRFKNMKSAHKDAHDNIENLELQFDSALNYFKGAIGEYK